jgi:hypothetical protein
MVKHWRHSYHLAWSNPYEDPRCQETNSPYERIFSFFPQL